MSVWRKEFHTKIVEVGTPPEYVYNADQIGVYYQQLSNCVYVDEADKTYYAGVKWIKDKTFIKVGGKFQFLYLGNRKSKMIQTDGWHKSTRLVQKPSKCLVWSKITL